MDVGRYMTRSPHTIGVEQSLTAARRLMSEHHVRHLPVLHAGALVGVLSDREVEAFEVLPGSRHLTVEEAMVPSVYVTFENAPLDQVAEEMASRRVGSAVVVAGSEGARVLGVFTAVDALRALADALRSAPPTTSESRNAAVTEG
jgi:acetoin utilization protein AcuB